MTRTIFSLSFFLFTFSFCYAQNADSILAAQQKQRLLLIEWFHDRNSDHKLLDSATEQCLRDSGRYENGLKTGLWNEYSIDSSLMGIQTDVQFGSRKSQLTFNAKLVKSTGVYSNGKKNGVWTEYKTDNVKAPLYWRRTVVTEYKDGEKDGQEIVYQGYLDQTPFIIRNWPDGQQSGITEIYDHNYPYALQQKVKVVNSVSSVTETYYPNGQLQATFTDTIVNGQSLKYLRQYFQSGVLAKTGFYLDTLKVGVWTDYYSNKNIECTSTYSQGKLDGPYKYYHDNGQLWTERIFKDGKLLEVTSNYNRNGEPLFPGTIKNGNGTVVLYDESGNLVKTILYENGIEKY